MRWPLHLAVLIALALAMFLFNLGADWHDGLDAEGPQIIQAMLRGEGWVLPLHNGRRIPFKPPLFHWLGALSATARGSHVDLLDPRLPSAVLAALCAASVYLVARRHADESVALWAGLILLTTPQFVIEARNSRVDMVLCLLLTAALSLAYQVWRGAAGRGVALAAGFCLGLAVLSKGPVALGLFVLVFLVAAFTAPPASGWRALLSPAALAAALLPPIVWYAAAAWQHGMPFLRLHLYGENMSRVLGGQGYRSIFWYLEPLLTGGLPWIVLLPLAIAGASRLAEHPRRFLWTWAGVMLLFFSLTPGKRHVYLLPLRPALAILIAGWLAPQLARLRGELRGAAIPRPVHVAVVALLLGGIGALLALRYGVGGFGASDMEWSYWWRRYLDTHFGTAVALVAGIAVGIELLVASIARGRVDRAAYVFVAALAWGLTIAIAAAAGVRGEGGSVQPLAGAILAELGADEPLAFFHADDRDHLALLFHLRRQVPVAAPAGQNPCTPPRPGLYLIAAAAWAEQACFRTPEWTEVARGGPAVDRQRKLWLVVARYAPAP
jgi:4-amino-4-deoxy-L-arabinose transferase-like glycosyltransferase